MSYIPKLVKHGEKVGYTYFERRFCFSACKNNIEDACEKFKHNETVESAFTVERDIFDYNIRIMKDIIGKLEVVKNGPYNELVIRDVIAKFGF